MHPVATNTPGQLVTTTSVVSYPSIHTPGKLASALSVLLDHLPILGTRRLVDRRVESIRSYYLS